MVRSLVQARPQLSSRRPASVSHFDDNSARPSVLVLSSCPAPYCRPVPPSLGQRHFCGDRNLAAFEGIDFRLERLHPLLLALRIELRLVRLLRCLPAGLALSLLHSVAANRECRARLGLVQVELVVAKVGRELNPVPDTNPPIV
jgi:hypothetical protein